MQRKRERDCAFENAWSFLRINWNWWWDLDNAQYFYYCSNKNQPFIIHTLIPIPWAPLYVYRLRLNWKLITMMMTFWRLIFTYCDAHRVQLTIDVFHMDWEMATHKKHNNKQQWSHGTKFAHKHTHTDNGPICFFLLTLTNWLLLEISMEFSTDTLLDGIDVRIAHLFVCNSPIRIISWKVFENICTKFLWRHFFGNFCCFHFRAYAVLFIWNWFRTKNVWILLALNELQLVYMFIQWCPMTQQFIFWIFPSDF